MYKLRYAQKHTDKNVRALLTNVSLVDDAGESRVRQTCALDFVRERVPAQATTVRPANGLGATWLGTCNPM
jgi:hypothetical protein